MDLSVIGFVETETPQLIFSFAFSLPLCCVSSIGRPETIALDLKPGSWLVMAGETQRHWLHELPKALRVTEPRVNLTFRRMLDA